MENVHFHNLPCTIKLANLPTRGKFEAFPIKIHRKVVSKSAQSNLGGLRASSSVVRDRIVCIKLNRLSKHMGE